MKFIVLFLSVFMLSCTSEKKTLTSKKIIEESIQYHDANNQWNQTILSVRIQEPRVNNPERFSIITLNNKDNSFVLQRNRDQHISTHMINKKGIASTTLNNQIVTDSALIKRYRLEPNRNTKYYRFYKTLLGLPMSLPAEVKEIKAFTKTSFNNKEAYKVPVKLKQPLFFEYWNVYFSQKDYRIIGLDMVSPNNPAEGERLIFEGEYKQNQLIIPRVRHWRELNNKYAGSDIIMNINN